jgi:hypothetical protein
MIRWAWEELWQKNRAGGILTLAFWYTLVTSLYQYLVDSRIGPLLPKKFQEMLRSPGHIVALPHLTPTLWVKLILVYLTFFLIVLPFTLGGLYGGIASTVKNRETVPGFLAFFRYAVENFWRALAQLVLTGIFVGLTVFVFALVLGLLSALPRAFYDVLSVILLLVMLAAILTMVAMILYWLGSTFYGRVSPAQGWVRAAQWVLRHWGYAWSSMVLLIGLSLAAFLVVMVFAQIPFLGPIAAVLILGMVFPSYLAVYAMGFYQQAVNSGIGPRA